MKKLTKILTIILAITCLFAFTACKKPVVVDGDSVIITARSSEYDIEGKTLAEFMVIIGEDDKLEYEVKDGMVTSINGKSNITNSYWMLYTDDTENSNEAWGTVEYDGKTYASASLGATDLIVKDGATYIWVYQTF